MEEPGDADRARPATHPADLPAVEPPTAGFIVQLFLIPALIVGVIVLVYLLFGKIAASQRSTKDYLTDLLGANEERRGLAARDLASVLPYDKELQNDDAFAEQLAAVFQSELLKGATGDRNLQFLRYLAVALGEFNCPAAVVPALRQAAQSGVERDVRWAAISSLGSLGERFAGTEDPAVASELVNAVRELSQVGKDDDPGIRTLVVYALRAIGRPEAIDALLPLLNDSNHEVRYNAANSLARLGSAASLDTLQEMLELDRDRLRTLGVLDRQLDAVLEEEVVSALESLSLLLDKSPDVNLQALRPDVERLGTSKNIRVQTSARKLLIKSNLAER